MPFLHSNIFILKINNNMAAGDITIIKWEEADFKYEKAPPSKTYKPGFKPSSFPYTWDDVALIEELVLVPSFTKS